MSKSKGNVIDPLKIIEEYGTDALRIALTSSISTAKQIDLDFRKFEEGKNFANKLWNCTSFAFQNIFKDAFKGFNEDKLKVEDNWILTNFQKLNSSSKSQIEDFQFSDFWKSIYQFFWNDFCSYYLELSKPYLYGKLGDEEDAANKKWILLYLLTSIVKILHPIAPFITEEIFGLLKDATKDFTYGDNWLEESLKDSLRPSKCIESVFSNDTYKDERSVEIFESLKSLVYAIRNVRQETNIPPGEKVKIYIEEKTSSLSPFEAVISSLTKVSSIEFFKEMPDVSEPCSIAALEDRKILVFIPETLIAKEKARLIKTLEKTLGTLENTKKQLANKQFVERAPKALIDEKRELLTKLNETKDEIEKKIKAFS